MRILLLAPHPFFQLRGTPIAERALLETLVEEGHEFDVVTYPEGEDPEVPACRIHRVVRLPGLDGIPPGFSAGKLAYDLLLALKAARLLERRRYDLVHAVEESVFVARLLRSLRGVPYVYDMDSSLVEQLVDRFPFLSPVERVLETLEGAAIRGATGVLTVSDALAERARRHAPEANVAVAEDTSLIDPRARPARPRDLPRGDAALVLYVGNLQPIQGIDLLLDAQRELADRGVGARLVVVGGSEETLERYRRLSTRLGIEDRATFLGPRPLERLGAYLTHADVLVSPRLAGSNTPMKIYSYMDSGRPIVATRVPAHEQVLDDTTARLVDVDAAAVAAGIEELLSSAVDARERAAAARALARREYSVEAFQRKVRNFYRDIERHLRSGRAVASNTGSAE